MISNKTDFNYTHLNNITLIQMYIIPNQDWHVEYESFNMSKLNFTWNCIGFKNKMLIFSLKFNNPLEISPKSVQDKILINLSKAVELGYIKSYEGKDLRN